MLLPVPVEVHPIAGLHAVPQSRGCAGWEPGVLSPSLEGELGLAATTEIPWVRWMPDAASPKGAYTLRINPNNPIEITAGSQEGARHALATLAQLVRANPIGIPCQVIHDRPAFRVRGVMLDVSRDRVPTMTHLREIVDLLVNLKFNHLQLYTEHTFAYEGHEEVWSGWSPMTPQEVRELDAYASVRGIELAANQNCFGHMVPWLRHSAYANLAETHGDWMFDIWPRSGPFSLCPTIPESIAFVEGLLDQLLPCFTSPHVNIGCDEVYDIAFGRSRAEVERRGRAAVYMEFVRKIAAAVRHRGKRAQFWGDIALSHPECVADIPPDVTALAWGYEPDSPFNQWGEMLNGHPFWVCPGTSTWRSITGRTTERRGNLTAAAIGGLRHGAEGYLVCDWGDSGHHQQWPLTMHALAQAAQVAWNPERAFSAEAESLHLFGDPTGETSRWLDAIGDADLPLREVCGALSHPTRTRLLNQTAVFIDMFKQLGEQREVGPIQFWSDALARLESLARRIPAEGLSTLVREELTHTARYALTAARRGVARRGGNTAALTSLPDEFRSLAAEHARLWLCRSREGGLSHSLTYFDQVTGSFTAPAAGEVTLFE
ncbi:MAG: family 20 glycosylhydrolase [Phycisphaerae bacterium]|nr:family 20 glycosylhydrolase [Phycisphaerae bacterium]